MMSRWFQHPLGISRQSGARRTPLWSPKTRLSETANEHYSYFINTEVYDTVLWPVAALFGVDPITYASAISLAPAAACHDALHAPSAGAKGASGERSLNRRCVHSLDRGAEAQSIGVRLPSTTWLSVGNTGKSTRRLQCMRRSDFASATEAMPPWRD